MFSAKNNKKFVLENWLANRSSREKVEIRRFVRKVRNQQQRSPMIDQISSDGIGMTTWLRLSEATSNEIDLEK